jgi:DNA replication and repair protein RecF
MDWGVFHVEHAFQDAWRFFNRAIRQRNAALKSGSHAGLHIWDADLVKHGEVIHECRQRYLAALQPFVDDVAKRLLSFEVEAEYFQGWRRNICLQEALEENRLRDLQRGTTCSGPHRAELILKVDGHPARDRISRGQQKMLACTLILAQQLHRASLAVSPGCLLLDDPAAELDVVNLGKLLEIVNSLPVQLIVTALSDFGLEALKNGKLFHVEHGSIKAMA